MNGKIYSDILRNNLSREYADNLALAWTVAGQGPETLLQDSQVVA